MVNTGHIIIEARTGQQVEPSRITYKNFAQRLKNIASSANMLAMEGDDNELYFNTVGSVGGGMKGHAVCKKAARSTYSMQ